MRTSKFTETQIVATLKQADAGVPVKDICSHQKGVREHFRLKRLAAGGHRRKNSPTPFWSLRRLSWIERLGIVGPCAAHASNCPGFPCTSPTAG